MARKPSTLSRTELLDSREQDSNLGISTPLLFAAGTALLVKFYEWPRYWLLSGAPLLTFFILLGSAKGYRILPFIHLWTLLATINLAYAVAATSWLLSALFLLGCYPASFLTCLFQFDLVANWMRRNLRSLLKQLHFVNDTIAFFDLPALEIDTDVDGLMVVRGLTLSLSTLTVVAHGVEVGIKLTDDMELSIQTEKVTVSLLRGVDVDDCFACIKGGEREMTFGSMEKRTVDSDGDAVMAENTPLLKAASATGDRSRPPMVKMASRMTAGAVLKSTSAKSGLSSMKRLSPDNELAVEQYESALKWIKKTSLVRQCRDKITETAKANDKEVEGDGEGDDANEFDRRNVYDMRAAICSQLHDKPSIPHPPKMSIKVTTIQNLTPPHIRKFMHRLPMLLRLLLGPLSYLHPISISSITATGSGRWISSLLQDKVFEHYGQENAELRRLEAKVSSWLSDAYFAIQLVDIAGQAQVPLSSSFDIVCQIEVNDILAHRSVKDEVNLRQVIRLGGADATFAIPTFLLPHHEHLLPPVPTPQDKAEIQHEVEEADGKPKTVQKEHKLSLVEKDETNVKMAIHGRLPACLDQELLNFIAALVKATKVVELEKEPSAMDREMSDIGDFAKSLHRGVKDGFKKVVVDGIVNDRWVAKLVGKITKQLETARGDVGYSGDIPVPLAPYRLPEGSIEAKKLLA